LKCNYMIMKKWGTGRRMQT